MVKSVHFSNTQGLTLIEVLVAFLIIAIAGFSILGMTHFSQQDSNSLKFEISADYLARSFLSRAEINATTSNKTTYVLNSNGTTPTGSVNCDDGCSSDDLAKLDITEWTQEAKKLLPEIEYKSWWDNNQLHLAIAWQGILKLDQEQDCPFSLKDNKACKLYLTSIPL